MFWFAYEVIVRKGWEDSERMTNDWLPRRVMAFPQSNARVIGRGGQRFG